MEIFPVTPLFSVTVLGSDEDLAEEVGQQKQDLIKSVIVKYMFDFRDYNAARIMINEISDVAALESLKQEKQILDNLLQDR